MANENLLKVLGGKGIKKGYPIKYNLEQSW